MSAVLERIRAQARARVRRLALVEGEDPRVLGAARRLAADGLAQPVILGDLEAVRAHAARLGVSLAGIALEPADDARAIERTRAALAEARGRRLSDPELEIYARDPLFQAAAQVAAGAVDCAVAGAVRTTSDVVRAALWLVGTAEGVRAVSSFFLMVVPARAEAPERVLLFTDCGVQPDPDPERLAEIALLAGDRFEQLTGEAARIAFLSFSTHGSAQHARVDKVREAVAEARRRRPEARLDGELQADAALDPRVAARKAPHSPVAGQANVLVFPDLDSGNIGYKLVQRLAGAEAYGPILQGLRRPMVDLSRGCDEDDVVHVATIACVSSPAEAAAR